MRFAKHMENRSKLTKALQQILSGWDKSRVIKHTGYHVSCRVATTVSLRSISPAEREKAFRLTSSHVSGMDNVANQVQN